VGRAIEPGEQVQRDKSIGESVRSVLVIQRRLTEYRVPFLEALKMELARRSIRLYASHGTPATDERRRADHGDLPWSLTCRTRYVDLLGVRLSWVTKQAARRTKYDAVVVTHENGILSNYVWFLRRALGGPRVLWWGHGPKVVSKHPSFRERLKAQTARWADGYLAYTSQSVERVLAAGLHADAVTCLNNAVETGTFPAPGDDAWESDRTSLRRSLDLGDGPVAIFLGSITREKRPDFLLAAAEELRSRIPGFELLIVGDGPLAGLVEEASVRHGWIHCLGVRHGREKALACSLARVLLNPGMVGLSIVDAFGFGLPMITVASDRHSPEIAYLRHGENGLITVNDIGAYVAGVQSVLCDEGLFARLRAGCDESARRITIGEMARNFASGVSKVLGASAPGPSVVVSGAPRLTLAFVVRSLLPPHVARLRHLQDALRTSGVRLVQIEVASIDSAYGFGAGAAREGEERYCCFPGRDYQALSAREVRSGVLAILREVAPDVVYGHATPFPEGMAAIAYRNESHARVFLFEDAWSATDRSGPSVRLVKRLIHGCVDGAIVSSAAHARHQASLGIPIDRISDGWSVVDNDYYRSQAARAWEEEANTRTRLDLPPRYVVYVGRFLARKGIDTLLEAFARLQARSASPVALLLVGGRREELPQDVSVGSGVRFCGRRFGDDLARTVALAEALVIPSRLEQWGLVTNEALAAGTPVVVSRACGSAQLVLDGLNGFTFDAGDIEGLASALGKIASLPEATRSAMRGAAQASMEEWGLRRFARGVARTLKLTRRLPPPILGSAAAWAWRGRVRAY
jgi:glycosyltransferase involved in cell wall biosynthesis